ncbi:MAG: inositol-3-phosphate synthase [Tannerellaceae bacterium]|jgi:myo-inositol-1-phosphate synthase|nr:inositol-3-phosphate synthase [Tannerellaceae bacterium]
MEKVEVRDAQGKLGVMVVGVGGAVASTFIAGTLSVRKGIGRPVGSITQLATIRLGKRNDNRFPRIKDVIPLASIDDMVFGGWDIFSDNIYDAALHAEVLKKDDLDAVRDELEAIRPLPAVFDQNFVRRLNGVHIKPETSRREYTNLIREDIRRFKAENNCDRIVVMWAASTEVYIEEGPEHKSLSAFDRALDEDIAPAISPSMCYAYAAISEGAPFIMGAPNLCVETPAICELAAKFGVPICGKDYKTGQTLIKTVLAPMLKTRMLGLDGWFSTNILGNRDGEVLDDPGSFRTKEVSKLSVIDSILQPEVYPDLYGNIYHKVRINYYPPRKDNKEGWDNIDIVGWLGYPMQLKVDFLCRDSILAAPLCLDLVLFSDLALRCGFSGMQAWLSFYFKSPVHKEGSVPEHDLFIQHTILKNTLRTIIGEPTLNYLD